MGWYNSWLLTSIHSEVPRKCASRRVFVVLVCIPRCVAMCNYAYNKLSLSLEAPLTAHPCATQWPRLGWPPQGGWPLAALWEAAGAMFAWLWNPCPYSTRRYDLGVTLIPKSVTQLLLVAMFLNVKANHVSCICLLYSYRTMCFVSGALAIWISI